LSSRVFLPRSAACLTFFLYDKRPDSKTSNTNTITADSRTSTAFNSFQNDISSTSSTHPSRPHNRCRHQRPSPRPTTSPSPSRSSSASTTSKPEALDGVSRCTGRCRPYESCCRKISWRSFPIRMLIAPRWSAESRLRFRFSILVLVRREAQVRRRWRARGLGSRERS
jgi:hypothetical protein